MFEKERKFLWNKSVDGNSSRTHNSQLRIPIHLRVSCQLLPLGATINDPGKPWQIFNKMTQHCAFGVEVVWGNQDVRLSSPFYFFAEQYLVGLRVHPFHLSEHRGLKHRGLLSF